MPALLRLASVSKILYCEISLMFGGHNEQTLSGEFVSPDKQVIVGVIKSTQYYQSHPLSALAFFDDMLVKTA